MQWSEEWGNLWGGPVSEIETHKADGLARLREQYADKVRMRKFLCVFLDRVQALEELLTMLRVLRSLDHAVGAQLDVIGVVVSLPRPSTDDEVYRLLLRFQIQLVLPNTSTIPGLVNIAIQINEGSTTGVEFIEGFPAAFCLLIPQQGNPLQPFYTQILRNAGALGVGACFVIFDPVQALFVDSTVAPLVDPNDIDSTVSALADAGIIASVIGP